MHMAEDDLRAIEMILIGKAGYLIVVAIIMAPETGDHYERT